MKKFVVEDVKVGISKGGMACGPVSGHAVAEIRIRDLENGMVMYHSLAEVDGTLNFFETEESTFEFQIAEDCEDEEAMERFAESSSGGYDGYDEFYQDMVDQDTCDEEHAMIWKLLAYLVRASLEEIEQMKKKCISRCVGNFEIPMCDAEQEYQDGQDEEKEDGLESIEECLDALNDEFVGRRIDISDIPLEEDETPAGDYSSSVTFEDEKHQKYRLQYSIDVNDDAEITHVSWPKCEKLEGEKYVPCPDGEVSITQIYIVLRDELIGWL